MKMRYGSLMLAFAAMVLLPATLGAAENPAGLWAGTTVVPNRGTDEVKLVITTIDGGYAGLMTDSLREVAGDALRDVKFADGVLTFGFALIDGTAMTMKLTVTGDSMAGEWIHPEGGAGAITFERKKG